MLLRFILEGFLIGEEISLATIERNIISNISQAKLWQPEIGQLNMSFSVYENVVRLEVSVNNAFAVEIVKCEDNLGYIVLGIFFIKAANTFQ